MTDSAAIFKAKQELNQFLAEHPQYREMQKEIDIALKKAGSQHNRLAVIHTMMIRSLCKLNDALHGIKQEVTQLQDIIKE